MAAETPDDTVTPDDTETEVEVVAAAAETLDDTETPDDTEAEAEVVAVAPIDPDELAAIQVEIAALKRQLAAAQDPKKAKSKPGGERTWRKVVVWLLIVLSIVSVVASVSFVWAKATLGNEDQFVATLQPLPKEEAVSSVVSLAVAGGITEAAGVEAWVNESLPGGLRFLSVPVTNSIVEVIAAVTNEFIESDAFTPLWTAALRVTHKAATTVIDGTDGALVSESGVVAIDLDEIAGTVIERVEATGLELPEVEEETDLGEIVLFESAQLGALQSLAQLIDTAGWFMPFLAIVFIAAAIWVAPRRRRTAAILGFGSALGLALSLLALRYGRNALVDAIEEEANQLAAGAAWDLIVDRLYQITWALLVLALIVGLVAWLSGPGDRAVGARAWGSATVNRWREPAEESPNAFTGFIAEWKPTIEVVVVAVGLMFVLFGPSLTGFSVLLTAVVALAVIVAVEVLAVPEPEAPQTQDADDAEAAEVSSNS